MGEGWKTAVLLEQNGLDPEAQTGVLEALEASPASSLAFFGWLLYGFENRRLTSQDPGIASPVRFAASRFRRSEPAAAYRELAMVPPGELRALLKDPYGPGSRAAWRPILTAARDRGLGAFIDQYAVDASGDMPADVQRVNPEHERIAGPDPGSADDIWAAVRITAQIPAQVRAASLWLSGRDVGLSFLEERDLVAARTGIRAARKEIEAQFPGVRFRVRELRVAAGQGGVPEVEIVREEVL